MKLVTIMDELNIKQMRRDLSKEELNKEEMNEEEELWTIILECLGCFELEKEKKLKKEYNEKSGNKKI